MTPLGVVSCTNAEYHGGPGVSKSHLDVVERSPLHYWQAYVNPERPAREPTPAMVLGSAIHSAILEPDKWVDEYVTAPTDAPARPSARLRNAKKPGPSTLDAIAYWDDFDAEHAGKTVLTMEQWQTAIGCRMAVLKHEQANRLLTRGESEVSYFGLDPEHGEVVKCRTDRQCIEDGLILDVKSTVDASPRQFLRSVMDYRYHVQVPWYLDVIDAALDAQPFSRWVFLAIEKTPPYAIGLYTLPEEMVKAGRMAARRNLLDIVECRKRGVWPAYDDAVVELDMPGWMATRVGANSPEMEFA